MNREEKMSHDSESPMHKKKNPVDLSFNPEERQGLTTEQAQKALEEFGYNELPVVTVSLWWLFFLQFTGIMPYILEVVAIIAFAVGDWPDGIIVVAMLVANAIVGFKEQLEAAHSLVSEFIFK